MAGKHAVVAINTAVIIVLNAGNLKKESRDNNQFPGYLFQKKSSRIKTFKIY